MITLSVDNLESFDRFANALVGVIDTEEILDEAAAVLLNRIRTRFLAEQDPNKVKWQPSLAALRRRSGKYTYRNGKKYTATGTLFETGTLFHSIQLANTPPGERSIATNVPYAGYMNYGTAKFKPRVFLGFGQDDLSVATRLILLRVKQQLKNAFAGAVE